MSAFPAVSSTWRDCPVMNDAQRRGGRRTELARRWTPEVEHAEHRSSCAKSSTSTKVRAALECFDA